MNDIIPITGNVKFQLTLDPGVWIFDDRKVEIKEFFSKETEKKDELEDYVKSASENWDRTRKQGAILPPVNKSINRFEKEKALTGTFGILLEPFLKNAEPGEDAALLLIERSQEETISIPLEQAYGSLLGFSVNGKPLKEDGPIHFYYGDGSNQSEPIKNIKRLIVK
ncbi:peptidyl-prolyl cis-trans isomerase [Pseudalkalibacillus caeni]|uniref:Peptidyl-prolyl cis-trans isomerase n=1 Tax=Exobacillus caeni TaxID=2574798 RepID=A0A5R9F9Z3_9BACL|nr:peptidyl-prolyl cis-trans isomerase [Pseudalkalibacillus caeni]TLS37673.1 peptidyl-prolyl cis-trans isomerase [Pseudalkalibacillus caeni]